MVYKKYIKRGKKLYGPYKYHSRKVNGKVITEYLGKHEEKNKKNKTLIFLIIGFLLLFSFVFFALNYKNINPTWAIDLADSVSGVISSSLTSIKTMTGFVVSEDLGNESATEQDQKIKEISEPKSEELDSSFNKSDESETGEQDSNQTTLEKTNETQEENKTSMKNITIENQTIVSNLTSNETINETLPEANLTNVTEADQETIEQIPKNITIKENITEQIPENITKINITQANATIITTQYQAVIGKPVKWKKHISLEEPKNLTIKLPGNSKNINIKKVEENENNFPISSKITGSVIGGKSEGFLSRFFKKIFRLTGGAIGIEETQEEMEVELNDTATEYEIEYETPAPEAFEETITKGKKITIVGPENIHYENVLAFTKIPESPKDTIKLYRTTDGIREQVQITSYEDTNENGLVDYIEWIVPSLSEQTYELIIEITKAEHLDSEKNFISDIYEEVKELDNIWSETIPSEDYVRITFEENLTNKNDITIYPRIVDGSPQIEVYKKDSTEIIAEFTNIISNQYNKVLLTNLQGSQNIFDLLILGGSLQFDHIVDPYYSIDFSGFESGIQGWTFTDADSARDNTIDYCSDTLCPDTGDWSARVMDDSATSNFYKDFDFTGKDTINISFWHYPTGIGTNEYITLDCDTTEIWRWTNGDPGEDSWTFHSIKITSGTECTFDDATRLIFDSAPGYSKDDDLSYFDGINVTGYSAPQDYDWPIFSDYNETPANDTAYSSGATYQFNATITSTNGTAGLEFEGTNYTATNISDVFNISVSDLSVGTYSYYWWAYGNGTANNLNTSGTRSYTVAQATPTISGSVSTPITYGTASNYEGTESNTGDGGCSYSLKRNGVEIATGSSVSDTDVLGVTTWNYNYSTSGCVNYSAGSDYDSLVIDKAIPKGNLTNTTSWTVEYPTEVTIGLNESNNGDGDVVYTVYRDGVNKSSGETIILGYGTYNYILNATEGTNYTANSSMDAKTLTVSQNTSLQLGLDITPSQSETYGTQTTANGTGCPSQLICKLYRNDTGEVTNGESVTLGVGIYNYTYNTTGNENYSATSISKLLTITKANNPVTLLLNGNANNVTIPYPQQLNATASSTGGTVKIFRNGNNITSENGQNITLGVGYYTYLANATGNANYSDNSTGITFYANITQAIGEINGTINGTQGNFTAMNGTTNLNIYINATNITGYGTGKIYVNGTLYNEGTLPLYNLTNLSIGLYNITFEYDGNTNYTSDSEVWWVNVTEAAADAPPSVTLNEPVNYANLSNQTVNFNCSVEDDNGIVNVTLYGNWSGTWEENETNSSGTNNADYIFTETISDGTYKWNCQACDNATPTTQCSFATENKTFTIDSTAPTITLPVYPNATQKKNTEDLILNISVDDGSGVGVDSCIVNVETGAGNQTITYSNGWCNGTYNLAGTSDSNQTINVYANDTAGNYGLNDSYVVWIDSTAPTITLPIYPNATKKKNTENLTLNISVDDGSGVGVDSCVVNVETATASNQTITYSNEWCNGTYSLEDANDGNQTINVYANDTLNNWGLNNSYVVWIDSTPPIITVVSPLNQNYTTITVDFNVSLNEDGDWCGFSLDSAANVTMTKFNNTYFNYTNFSMTQGNHNVVYSCNDTLNNLNNTEQVTFFIDSIAPYFTDSTPQDQSISYKVALSHDINATDSGLGLDSFNVNDSRFKINSTSGLLENNTILGVNEYYLNITINDTVNNLNSTVMLVNITKAQSEVNLTLNETDGNVTITQDSSILLNGTLITGDAAGTLKLYNDNILINEDTIEVSNQTDFNVVGIFNITVYYIKSQNYTGSYETWWVNVTEAPDSQNPNVTLLPESPTSPVDYAEGAVYEFNATITDNRELDTVLLDFNGTNYTATNLTADIYNVTFTDLAVNTYYYRWFANDTSGLINNTENGTYTIQKATPSLNITFSPSDNENYGTETTVNGTNCPPQLNCKLYRNDTGEITPPDVATLGVGAYNYTYNTTGNANYTSTSVSDILTINQNTGSCNVLFNESSPINYSTIFRVWTNCTSDSVLYRNSSAIDNNSNQSLGASSYNFTVIRNDTINYSNYYDEETFIVQQATGIVYTYVNNLQSNITIEQFTEIYLNGTLETGQEGENITLYYNNTLIEQGLSPLSNLTNFTQIGLFNITTFYDGNENYTSSYETWWVNATEADVTAPQISITYPQNISYNEIQTQLNYTAWDDFGLNECWYSINNGQTNETITCNENITDLNSGQDSSTWTVWANDSKGNENSSSVTFFVDSIDPTIQFVSPTETSGTSLGRNYIQVNVTASDTNLENITIRLYNLTKDLVRANISISPFYINYTGLIAGTYYFNATANDTLGNNISTETKNVTLVLPSLTIIKPKNETYLTNTSLLLNYTVSYEDYVLYNIDNTENTTIFGNTTFNTSEGQHTLYLYANNSLGTTTKNVTFTVNLTKFIILYSEYNGSTRGSSTDFILYTYEDIQNLSEVILENTDYGKISFNQAVNLTDDVNVSDNEADLDANIDISDNRIEIDSTALPNFNKSATLYFYGLSSVSKKALRNEEECSLQICTTPVLSAEIWSFNITQFTSYSLEDDVTSAVTPPPGEVPSGGGDGRSPECINNSDCEKDEICWNHKCVKLFDIKIIDFESPVELGEFFDFTYFLKGMADINDDVEIQFWIEKNGEKVTSGSDTIYLGSFEEKTETTKIFLPSNVESGVYTFYIQVLHQAYEAKSHRTIEITVKDGIATITPIEKDFRTYIIFALIGLIIFILFLIILKRKKLKTKIIQGWQLRKREKQKEILEEKFKQPQVKWTKKRFHPPLELRKNLTNLYDTIRTFLLKFTHNIRILLLEKKKKKMQRKFEERKSAEQLVKEVKEEIKRKPIFQPAKVKKIKIIKEAKVKPRTLTKIKIIKPKLPPIKTFDKKPEEIKKKISEKPVEFKKIQTNQEIVEELIKKSKEKPLKKVKRIVKEPQQRPEKDEDALEEMFEEKQQKISKQDKIKPEKDKNLRRKPQEKTKEELDEILDKIEKKETAKEKSVEQKE